ncbi:GNAT family N-acetyltransferase [Paracoccus alkanivorans]|uniref:GNAT family N-acetyltransferase n=1 Tax=Paracoccus alkanivorans TaxID=2116655 RepID=A0A3M0MT10_9RHOB|nr:GNAT family N-acetyltransferase [Paracoccus alkanivorans]RMC34417.1 GNAT family N-acetyltransferase [Paracoccus alkanivorans]
MFQRANIRPAQDADVNQISDLVQRTIRISNGRDYSAAVIERVANNFTTGMVHEFLRQRAVLVAHDAEKIVGTAGLQGDVVRTVFVLPEMQGLGIGRQLMDAIETLANREGVPILRVPASLTARSFYARLGYVEINEVLHGEERTIVMEKVLG